MGNKTSKSVKDVPAADTEEKDEHLRVLLLGLSGSGKSTFGVSAKMAYDAFKTEDKRKWTDLIRNNCGIAILELIDLIQKASDDCAFAKYQDCVEVLELFTNHYRSDLGQIELLQIQKAIKIIWNLDMIQQEFKNRNKPKHWYTLLENMEYFYNQIDVVMDQSYEATYKDILCARHRTTGCIQYKFKDQDNEKWDLFELYMRNARRRRHCLMYFDTLDVIIFMHGLNGYCKILWDDEDDLQFDESLLEYKKLVENIPNYFKDLPIVVVLNKTDL